MKKLLSGIVLLLLGIVLNRSVNRQKYLVAERSNK